jgi:hypothetical protein
VSAGAGLRIPRGLFRLWLVLSVLWIAGVGIYAWWSFPTEVPPWAASSPSEVASLLAEDRRSAIWEASLLAVLPPAFVLALGSALVWAFRGFR